MFCSHCGTQLDDSAAFCPVCGTPTGRQAAAPAAPAASVYAQPAPTASVYAAPVNATPAAEEPKEPDTSNQNGAVVLTMGILAFVFCVFGLPGIIFGGIGKGKSSGYFERDGALCGSAKTGRVFSKLGLGFGIAFAVLWTVYIVIALSVGAFVFV